MDIVSEAFEPAQKLIAEVCVIQQDFLAKCTIVAKEITINYPTAEQLDQMHAVVTDEHISGLFKQEKTEFDALYKKLEKQLYEHFKPLTEEKDSGRRGSTVNMGFFALVKKYIRKNIIEKGVRIDGRTVDQIRTIYCEHGLIPRSHGC
jgi:polyribonucleotide nucleotidyltransferase